MEYSGNILSDMLDRLRENTIAEQDHYICCECRTIVTESKWDFNKKLCKECSKGELNAT